jgi:hypothetical protein
VIFPINLLLLSFILLQTTLPLPVPLLLLLFVRYVARNLLLLLFLILLTLFPVLAPLLLLLILDDPVMSSVSDVPSVAGTPASNSGTQHEQKRCQQQQGCH